MPSTFFGMEIARRSLFANQTALDVVGQNVSNVNTPGYSRQVVNFQETDPYTPPDFDHTKPGNLGTGVTVASVNRVRDEFVDKQVYAANSQQGALTNLRDITGRVENAYNEPSANGLGQQITSFFNSFSDLTPNAQSGAIRSTVRNSAETMVSQFHSLNTALNQIQPEITSKINVTIGNVNDIAKQIATLNHSIAVSLAAGDQPNDLQDSRGALLNQLSNLVDVQVSDMTDSQTGKPNGEIQINVGGFSLVQGETASKLPTTVTTSGNTLGLTTPAGDTIPLRSGQLYGLVKASTLVAGYKADLNTLASSLITTVNGIHRQGYGLDGSTNNDFFAGTDAASISVAPAIENSLDAIAAASPTSPAPAPPAAPFAAGNADNARAIAALVSAPVIGSFSLNDYYNDKVAQIGADSQSYISQADNQDKVVNQLNNQQASVSGVSMDEELSRMLQYQRSYQAAARMLNIQDDVLNTIINGLGAGR